MSRYKNGLRTPFQKESTNHYKRGTHVGGPWIATPGYIKGEIARLQTEMVAFNEDVIKSLSASFIRWLALQPPEVVREALSKSGAKDYEDLKTRWGVLGYFPDSPLYNFFQFYNTTWITVYRGWLAFYDDHKTFRDWYWGSVLSSVEAWRRQLVGCREQVVQFEGITLDDGSEAGMVITSPDPEKGDDWALTELFRGAGDLFGKLIIGGIVVIVGFLGLKLVQRGTSGSSTPSLPRAEASPPRKLTKGQAQRERVLAAMERKEK